MKGGFGRFVFGALIVFCIISALVSFFGDDNDLSGSNYGYSFEDDGGDYGFDFEDDYLDNSNGTEIDTDRNDTDRNDSDTSKGSSSDRISGTSYKLPKHRSMYNELNATEKEIYNRIRDTLASGSLTAHFDNIGYSEYDGFVESLYDAYDAVYYDFPEFFWLNSGWSWSPKVSSKLNAYEGTLEMTCYDFWKYTTDKSGYIDAVITEAQKIAAMAATRENDYEKIKFVHDYLVINAEYDYVCLEEINKTVQRASSQQSHTVYGALVNKVCVCDGYAKSFQLITSMLGIETVYIEGDAGGRHAWNYVILDGEEYWVDVTWDENEIENDNGGLLAPNGVNYNYFCIDDGELYATHLPDSEPFTRPVCDSYKYNFFRYEDSYLATYDFNELCEAIDNQRGAQIIHVKFGSEAELTKAREDIIKNGRYADVPYFKNKDIQFYYNSEKCVLHFYFP